MRKFAILFPPAFADRAVALPRDRVLALSKHTRGQFTTIVSDQFTRPTAL